MFAEPEIATGMCMKTSTSNIAFVIIEKCVYMRVSIGIWLCFCSGRNLTDIRRYAQLECLGFSLWAARSALRCNFGVNEERLSSALRSASETNFGDPLDYSEGGELSQ